MINVYMPTSMHHEEQIGVVNFIDDSIKELNNENIILGGDLNIHIDNNLDCGNLKKANTFNRYRNKLLEFMDKHNLIDILRLQNHNKSLYTWFRNKSYSRLDYFLCSDINLNAKIEANILEHLLSDHLPIKLKIINQDSIKKSEMV